MPVIYRLSSVRYKASSGVGASLYPGRWNPKGVEVVYAGANRSLCILERVVHLATFLPDDEAFTTIDIPDDVHIADLDPLPRGWKSSTPRAAVQEAALAFAAVKDLPVLRVPSIIVPGESCYVLFPSHKDFSRIRFSKPELFLYDGRLRPDLKASR